MAADRVAVRLVVAGRVQGVGFRYACRRTAAEHGVAGSARNLPSGEVEVVLEGSPDAVAAVAAWAHHGPPGAAVADVRAEDVAPTGSTGFSIG
ncbi:acylphosphatase [Actinotalea solisilvae]|uniref:acylphosphatase n=1 Tax=Actinotalea solisilvae TaxID=2072922 RepID=UPI0018F16F73|nr:acylphosphatase [Actinotalea solisilvae]